MKIQRGFTLVEILIALAVFAIFSISAYQVLQGVLNSDQTTKEHVASLQRLQRVWLLMSRDFEQTTPRTFRIQGDEPKNRFIAGQYIQDSEDWSVTMVHWGWSNPQQHLPRSDLQQVGYILKEGELLRLSNLYPDPTPGSEPKVQVLLNNVKSFKLKFFADKQWLSTWDTPEKLPEGVTVDLELESFGHVSWVFVLANHNWQYDNSSPTPSGAKES